MILQTISDLRSTSGSADPYAKVICYSNPGDRGGGDFYWDPSSVEADNKGTIFKVTGITTGRWKRIYDGAVNIMWFGLDDSGATDCNPVLNEILQLFKNIYIPLPRNGGFYKTSFIRFKADQRVFAEKGVRFDIIFLSGTSPVLVGLQSNFYCENIWFNCIAGSLPQARIDLDSRENVQFVNCRIEGFVDTTSSNAWGLYLKNSKNIRIVNCQFENNTQSDIALLANCENVDIINAQGSQLHLNIEPSGLSNIININVIGGTYDLISQYENDLRGTSLKNCNFIGVTINNLSYNGGAVKFTNCRILNLIPGFSQAYGYAGNVDFGGALHFGQNLISDADIYDISNTSSVSCWFPGYSSGVNMLSRYAILNERVFQINPSNAEKIATMTTTVAIEGEKFYAIVLDSKSQYQGSPASAFISLVAFITYYDSSGNAIANTDKYLSFNRSTAGTTTNFEQQIGIVKSPATAVKIVLQVGLRQTTTQSLHIKKVGLFEVSCNNISNEFKQYLFLPTATYRNAPPVMITNAGINDLFYKNDIIYNSNSANNQPLGWVCVANGNPGTWIPFGKIDGTILIATSGITANRPASPPVGFAYFDTTLNKPVFFKSGTTWVDANGAGT